MHISKKLCLLDNQQMYHLLTLWATACGPFTFLEPTINPLFEGIQPLDVALEFHACTEVVRVELLSKCMTHRNPDSRDVAIEKFHRVEDHNRLINDRFTAIRDCGAFMTGDPSGSLVRRIRSRIRSLLGPLNSSVIKSVLNCAYLGPGLNIGSSSHSEHIRVKTRTITRDLHPYFHAVANETQISRFLLDADGPVSILNEYCCIESARLTTVPKKVNCDRVISVEPVINSFLQNGVGEYLRQRLKTKRFHNLYDQGHNQRLAIYPNATIDLSSASDSLAREVARFLLPHDWYTFLDLLRSKTYTLDRRTHSYELFCGQGNGFCFPLETVIFSAICFATSGEHPLAVYGDDIIVKHEYAEAIIRNLQLFGFTVNTSKSHWNLDDPYRESCGSHRYYRCVVPVVYYRGSGVDPFLGVISLHNRLRNFCEDYDLELRRFLYFLRRLVPDIGVGRPGYRGEYFHGFQDRRPKKVWFVKTVKKRYPKSSQGENLAIFHKVRPSHAGSEALMLGNFYSNRSCIQVGRLQSP